jgi:hypothetical protein
MVAAQGKRGESNACRFTAMLAGYVEPGRAGAERVPEPGGYVGGRGVTQISTSAVLPLPE